MARKQDKLRPYRVDYFDVKDMKDYDKALVRSVVVRAVTSAQAQNMVLWNDLTSEGDGEFVTGRHIIKSARFYKKLVLKRDVYKAVEDLFTANKAVAVMDEVEIYRKRKAIDDKFKTAAAPVCPFGYTKEDAERGSMTAHVCPLHPVTSGPESPATQAVIADLNGMTDHDTHEQVMDTFVPDPGQPDISKFDSPTDLLPGTPDFRFPDHAVVPTQPVVFNNGFFTPPPANLTDEPMPLWAKIALFGGVSIVAIIIVLALLHCGSVYPIK